MNPLNNSWRRVREGVSPLKRSAAVALVAAGAGALLAGCGSLFGPPPPPPNFYTLDLRPAAAPAAPVSASAPVLVVAVPRAAAGFGTDRIVYVREAHRLEPYADNQWVDTPARMLGPLITESLARTGRFAAVLATPSPANGQWELDTQVLRLQHEVPDTRVRFTLRASMVEKASRTVVATREFDAVAPTPGTNPAGAVAAANVAVADVLGQLAAFCVATVERAPARP